MLCMHNPLYEKQIFSCLFSLCFPLWFICSWESSKIGIDALQTLSYLGIFMTRLACTCTCARLYLRLTHFIKNLCQGKANNFPLRWILVGKNSVKHLISQSISFAERYSSIIVIYSMDDFHPFQTNGMKDFRRKKKIYNSTAFGRNMKCLSNSVCFLHYFQLCKIMMRIKKNVKQAHHIYKNLWTWTIIYILKNGIRFLCTKKI